MLFSDQDTLIQTPNSYYWSECLNLDVFDSALASLSGHPLQSFLWGNARYKVDGISQLLFEYCGKNGAIVGLARVEERNIPFFGKIAWIPKGPILPDVEADNAMDLLHAELKRRGFIICITDKYTISKTQNPRPSSTLWLNLKIGLDSLSKNIDSRVRYSAKLALREGVVIRTTVKPLEVSAFFRLCNALSIKKGFTLPGSEELMLELIRSSMQNGGVCMTLYVGEVGGVIIGGAIVARSGHHLHYLWGASDRRFSKYRVSEAIQWKIIQDGVASNMERYDLEGIDPIGNPSVYQFKKKLGGTEVTLQGMEVTSFSWIGNIVINMGRCLKKI